MVVQSPEQLEEVFNACYEASPQLILQELIEGRDTDKYVYMSCYGRHGRRLGSCIVREIRTWPVGFGPATVVEPVRDSEVDAVCDDFLKRAGYIGICEIEVKRDRRDGRVKMIEANPRHSGTGDVAPYMGVELGWLHYLDLIGIELDEVVPSRWGFRHIVLVKDALCIRNLRSARMITWWEALREYAPPVAFYDLDWRDYGVSARNLWQACRVMIGYVARWLFPKKARTASDSHLVRLVSQGDSANATAT
jgi:predicted ATP-grasp superfamily ATP-dependent carboligase